MTVYTRINMIKNNRVSANIISDIITGDYTIDELARRHHCTPYVVLFNALPLIISGDVSLSSDYKLIGDELDERQDILFESVRESCNVDLNLCFMGSNGHFAVLTSTDTGNKWLHTWNTDSIHIGFNEIESNLSPKTVHFMLYEKILMDITAMNDDGYFTRMAERVFQ